MDSKIFETIGVSEIGRISFSIDRGGCFFGSGITCAVFQAWPISLYIAHKSRSVSHWLTPHPLGRCQPSITLKLTALYNSLLSFGRAGTRCIEDVDPCHERSVYHWSHSSSQATGKEQHTDRTGHLLLSHT